MLVLLTTSIYSQQVKQCRAVLVGTRTQAQSAQARIDFNRKMNGTQYFQYTTGSSFSQGHQSHTPYSSGSYSRPSNYQPSNYQWYSPPIYYPRINSIRSPISRNKLRTFTNKEGGTFEGRLLSINATNKTARIRDKKGLSYNVSISRFCSSDVSYLKSWWTSRNPPKKITGYKAFLAKKRNG